MTDKELIQKLLSTADDLRLVRNEVHRRWKVGHAGLHNRSETNYLRQNGDNMAACMCEIAARLAANPAPPPATP